MIPKAADAPRPGPLQKEDNAEAFATYAKDPDLNKAMDTASMAMINGLVQKEGPDAPGCLRARQHDHGLSHCALYGRGQGGSLHHAEEPLDHTLSIIARSVHGEPGRISEAMQPCSGTAVDRPNQPGLDQARRRIATLVVLLPLLAGFGVPARAEAVRVVVTTQDLKSLAEAVSGGVVQVESLVPAGVDAEAFEPRPRDLALVKGAALVVRIGLGYDEWLDRLLAQSGSPELRRGGERYLDLSPGLALLEVQGRSVETGSGHAHGAANPHYWLDPADAETMSAAIAEALIRIVPEQREAIVVAHARFAAELRERLERWTRLLEPYRGAPIVTYHNGWPYFARRFRLNIVDVIEPKEGVPPSSARLIALASRMREAKVRVILQETLEPADASRALAQRTGARVVLLAPSVGGLPGVDNYFALFDSDVGLLAAALGEPR